MRGAEISLISAPRLEELSLDSRAINEQSLKQLRKIKSLKVLHVYFGGTLDDESKAVNALLDRIRKAMPQSVTIHDFYFVGPEFRSGGGIF